MERRENERTKKRIACKIRADNRHVSGFVLDVSQTGLFVQTSASLQIGSVVEVEFRLPDSETIIAMRATVARKRVVPHQLTAIARGGLGLRLEHPPPAYLKFVAEHRSDFAGERKTG